MGHFVAIVNRRGAAGYVIAFPDLPGCMATGESLEDVVREGREVLDLHLSDLAQQGAPAPVARTLDAVLADPKFVGGAPVLVPAPPLAGSTIRVQLTVAEDTLNHIDQHAEAIGQTRSAFMVDAARASIQQREAAEGRNAADQARAQAGQVVVDLWGSGDRRTSSFLARMAREGSRSHGILGRTPDGRPAPLSGPAQDEFRRFFEQTMKAAEHLRQRVADLEARPPIAIPRAGNDR